MTNEEAIKRLETYKTLFLEDFMSGEVPHIHGFDEAITLALSALSRDRWISVEERLPGYGEKCLVAFKLIGHNHWSIQVSYCYVQKEGFWSDCGRDYKAVAWRLLPEPPKEET